MNNSTGEIPIFATRNTINNNFITLYIVILVITLILHLLVQLSMYKARLLHHNNYYLILMLSIVDSLAILITMVKCGLILSGARSEMDLILKMLLSFLMHIFYSMSLLFTIFIALDRWIAMKFALTYHIIVTRKKINYIIGITTLAVAFIYIVLLFVPQKSIISINGGTLLVTSQHVLVFLNVLRILTCVFVIVLGYKTLRIRQENENRLQNRNNFHGTEAERIDIIQRLINGFKDVLKLNILTCIFLCPLIIASLARTFQPNPPFWLLIVSGLVNLFYLVSNPIIYLSCFSKIRDYLHHVLCSSRNEIGNSDHQNNENNIHDNSMV